MENRRFSLMENTFFEFCGDFDKNRDTVLVCPGGGYNFVAPREGAPVAEAFRRAGLNAAVLHYTVRSDRSLERAIFDLPLKETAEAASVIRKLTKGKLYICGFSAGGHLAASYGAHYQKYSGPRPDGIILGYPVISFESFAHRDTMLNLSDGADTFFYSVEKHVSADFPPCFIWATAGDEEVPVENSMMLAGALSAAKVPFELHIFPRGPHGLSLATKEVDEPAYGRYADAHIAEWFPLCIAWMSVS